MVMLEINKLQKLRIDKDTLLIHDNIFCVRRFNTFITDKSRLHSRIALRIVMLRKEQRDKCYFRNFLHIQSSRFSINEYDKH